MKGYYEDDIKTNAIIDKDGWLHTGDLAIMSREGDFSLVGRAKDTIVLSGGENIEPLPIEEALRSSQYIESAVVVGQDRKSLGALIVIDGKNSERYLKESWIKNLTYTIAKMNTKRNKDTSIRISFLLFVFISSLFKIP